MNACIITARKGSKSILNKNEMEVLGKPLVRYAIDYGLEASRVDEVFISTDAPGIAKIGRAAGVTIIERPEELCGDHVNHGDVIRHAARWVDERREGLENIVLLLGNSVMLSGRLIDRCLGEMEADPDLSGVMTVWEAADDHPFRALEIEGGRIRAWAGKPANISTERQSYPRIYYYDQGVWAFHKRWVESEDGPSPWWWMGPNVKPIVRTWVTGRDIHTHFDALVSRAWLGWNAEFRSTVPEED